MSEQLSQPIGPEPSSGQDLTSLMLPVGLAGMGGLLTSAIADRPAYEVAHDVTKGALGTYGDDPSYFGNVLNYAPYAQLAASMLAESIGAPQGHKLEGAGRGIIPGLTGAIGGGLGHKLSGGLARLFTEPYGQGHNIARALGLIAGGLAGGLTGDKINELVYGPPTWDRDEPEESDG